MTAPKEVIDNHEEVMPGVFAGVDNDDYHNKYEGESKTSICWAAKSINQYHTLNLHQTLIGSKVPNGFTLEKGISFDLFKGLWKYAGIKDWK